MKLAVGVVLILDRDATPFTRIWCCFEESIAAAQPKFSRNSSNHFPTEKVINKL
jgi:hypothetical protein